MLEMDATSTRAFPDASLLSCFNPRSVPEAHVAARTRIVWCDQGGKGRKKKLSRCGTPTGVQGKGMMIRLTPAVESAVWELGYFSVG